MSRRGISAVRRGPPPVQPLAKRGIRPVSNKNQNKQVISHQENLNVRELANQFASEIGADKFASQPKAVPGIRATNPRKQPPVDHYLYGNAKATQQRQQPNQINNYVNNNNYSVERRDSNPYPDQPRYNQHQPSQVERQPLYPVQQQTAALHAPPSRPQHQAFRGQATAPAQAQYQPANPNT